MQKILIGTALLAAAGTASAATSQRVVFESHGQRIVGDLYLPDDYQPGKRLPAVIVTGAWTTVKEQMPARYAAEMADRGYASLAFDFRNWGQSEGDRRQYENPANKTQDIVAAAAFLATRPEITHDQITGLGICASAGYMAQAAAESEHIRSLALVAPWLHNAEIVETVYGGAEGVNQLIAASQEADKQYHATSEATMLPAASTTDESAVMFNAPYYTEKNRGLIPEYVNEFNVASWEPWLTFDGITVADRLKDIPVQIVHSDAAAIPQGAKKFFARLTGEKQELWLEQVSQFDFYDQDESVKQATDAIADFLRKTRTDSSDVPDADQAALITIVESVAVLADTANFTALEKLYADEVHVDYSSLTGQPAELKSPQALMAQWAGVLPGFDRTRHTISNIQTNITGNTAEATAAVTASHWIHDLYWEVSGHYGYRFTHDQDGWKITSMTFTLTHESGTRDVFAPAAEAAQVEPSAYLKRRQSKSVILDFLEGLEEKDMDRVNGVWAENAVQEMPYAPKGFPKRVEGKHALIEHYAGWPKNAGEANFTDNLVFYPTLDPQLVFVEFRGVCEIVSTGRKYDQRYGGLFHVEDGKISLFREYFDPNVFAYAFKIEDGDISRFKAE